MALVGFSASAVQALTYQNGDYMGSLNKKASGAQCFIMALGLFWDIVTGLPWTPNGVGSLEPRGYCIFLPGAHYLTINSPYGADSSLNKLLLLLRLEWFQVIQWSAGMGLWEVLCSPSPIFENTIFNSPILCILYNILNGNYARCTVGSLPVQRLCPDFRHCTVL